MISNWAGKCDSELERDKFVLFACRWPKLVSANYGKNHWAVPELKY